MLSKYTCFDLNKQSFFISGLNYSILIHYQKWLNIENSTGVYVEINKEWKIFLHLRDGA